MLERNLQDITHLLKAKAAEVGFALSGVTAAAHPARFPKLVEWLAAGYAGEMLYIESRRDAYAHPANVLDGCRTLLMLGYPYSAQETSATKPGAGRVARYAWNREDYHDVVHQRLKQLRAWLLERRPQANVRGVVDTAPLAEREFAEAAGLGWVGKNTLLLNRQRGSYFYLAALLTDLELTLDDPIEKGYCGTCRACLDACPTKAFPAPYVLDATRCISYLTIETRGEIPPEFHEPIGDWLLGCDVCQDVCPWNRKAAKRKFEVPETVEQLQFVDLIELLSLDEQQFRNRYRHTALWRPKRVGLVRNATIILGNQRVTEAIPALTKLLDDEEPVLRATAAWAIEKIGS